MVLDSLQWRGSLLLNEMMIQPGTESFIAVNEGEALQKCTALRMCMRCVHLNSHVSLKDKLVNEQFSLIP